MKNATIKIPKNPEKLSSFFCNKILKNYRKILLVSAFSVCNEAFLLDLVWSLC